MNTVNTMNTMNTILLQDCTGQPKENQHSQGKIENELYENLNILKFKIVTCSQKFLRSVFNNSQTHGHLPEIVNL